MRRHGDAFSTLCLSRRRSAAELSLRGAHLGREMTPLNANSRIAVRHRPRNPIFTFSTFDQSAYLLQ